MDEFKLKAVPMSEGARISGGVPLTWKITTPAELPEVLSVGLRSGFSALQELFGPMVIGRILTRFSPMPTRRNGRWARLAPQVPVSLHFYYARFVDQTFSILFNRTAGQPGSQGLTLELCIRAMIEYVETAAGSTVIEPTDGGGAILGPMDWDKTRRSRIVGYIPLDWYLTPGLVRK